MNRRFGSRLINCVVLVLAGQCFASDPSPLHNVGTMNFQRAPVEAVADYFVMLSHQRVVVPVGTQALITYDSKRPLTEPEAFVAIGAALRSNNWQLVACNGGDFEFLPQAYLTNDLTRLKIEIEESHLLVDGKMSTLDEFKSAIRNLSLRNIEVWIYDPKSEWAYDDYETNPRTQRFLPPPQGTTNLQLRTLIPVLREAGVQRILRVHWRSNQVHLQD